AAAAAAEALPRGGTTGPRPPAATQPLRGAAMSKQAAIAEEKMTGISRPLLNHNCRDDPSYTY
ncbi:unnamed protein product, partial [Heterosigma akashiwo]